jgi:hypothetical protein
MADCTQYNELGNSLKVLKAIVQFAINKPLCVTEDAAVIFSKGPSTLSIHKDFLEYEYANVEPMVVVCICSSGYNGLIAALVHFRENKGAIVRFRDTGECRLCITHSLQKWTPQAIFPSKHNRYTSPKTSTAIFCLSTEGVDVIRPNGEHRFLYHETETSVSMQLQMRTILEFTFWIKTIFFYCATCLWKTSRSPHSFVHEQRQRPLCWLF